MVWLVLLMIGGIITAGFIHNTICAILFLLVALIGVVVTNRDSWLIMFWLITIFSFGWLNHSMSIHQSGFRADLAHQLDHETVSFQGIVRAVNDTDRGKRIEIDNLALNGDFISYTYDQMNRVITSTNKRGFTTTFTYNDEARTRRITDPLDRHFPMLIN